MYSYKYLLYIWKTLTNTTQNFDKLIVGFKEETLRERLVGNFDVSLAIFKFVKVFYRQTFAL